MFGLKKPSLLLRVSVGKTIGSVIGLAVFFGLPSIDPTASFIFRLGLLGYLITFGAFIGLMGVMTNHIVIKMPMPWWFRGSYIGAFLNLLVVLLAYEQMASMMIAANIGLESPFWFVLDGAILGLIIEYLCTRIGGEGPDTVNEMR